MSRHRRGRRLVSLRRSVLPRCCTPGGPGGLGFVEAGLVGTLTLAGVPSADALAATLLYRIVAYWLPLPAGGTAFLLFRRRYRTGNLTS